MNTPKTLGERLRLVRGKIPQELFSTPYGINQNTLSRYERNERTPDADFIALICKNNGVLAEWLLLGEGPMRQGEPSQSAKIALQHPVNTLETNSCARCAKLEAKVEEVDQERREMSAELREVNAENRRLARENMELSKQCATLTERQKTCCPDPLLQQPPPSALSSEMRAKA